jgi:uncharacterized protein (DUF2336 family)
MDYQASDMMADGATATPPPQEGWADDIVAGITAESFRKLTARLKAPRPAAAVPPLAPEPSAPQPPRRRERDPGEEAGDTVIGLIDLMASGPGLLPQERALAGDALLLLLPKLPPPQMVRLSERVALMDSPPPLLVARLIRDPRPEVMAPVLERNPNISDRDMMEAATPADKERLRMIARRRALSPALSLHLVSAGDPDAVLALLRNPGTELPHGAFPALCALAIETPAMLAPLVTRPELPASVAFELYWSLPPELRRFLLSRFLTESAALARILRIALAEDGGLAPGALREERSVDGPDLDAALAAAAAGRLEEAATGLSRVAGLAEGTLRRILQDPHGEPVAVLFKAMGLSRNRFIALAVQLGRTGEELMALYDSLSFTKARVLLAYWDWFTRETGPYAPRN